MMENTSNLVGLLPPGDAPITDQFGSVPTGTNCCKIQSTLQPKCTVIFNTLAISWPIYETDKKGGCY